MTKRQTQSMLSISSIYNRFLYFCKTMYDEEITYTQAIQLMKEGAEIIDIGAESTSPTVNAIDADMEWARLEPALTAILQIKNRLLMQ